MIHGEDHRPIAAHVLQPDHFDAPIEDSQREAKQRDEKCSHSRRPAPNVQITPEARIPSGTIKTATPRELLSERIPISGGDGTSPRMCMIRLDSATAVARSDGATALTIAEFTGPVDAKA